MLEQAVELECHANCPGKKPDVRIKTISSAGKLRIPFTTGLLIGIGESEYDREYSLEVIADLHKNYGHIQEVIIQNFTPKPNTPMERSKPPSVEEMLKTVKKAKEILPEDVVIQIPPNLVEDIYPFLIAGVRDLGGISEVTPDFINPDHPWPSVDVLRERLRCYGFELRERLPIYPKYVRLRWYCDEIAEVVEANADGMGFRIC
jgi:FO synthase subunit 1